MNLINNITTLPSPKIIAISGYGGAGKSTLAKKIAEKINAPIVSIDSFAKDSQMKNFSLWELMDYERMTKEVIRPFLQEKDTITYGEHDWDSNKIIQQVSFENKGKLIIEGVGLFRPTLLPYFHYKIWVNTSLEKAIAQGKARDKTQYNKSLDQYWDGIWKKNDIECFDTFQPLNVADYSYNL